MPKQAAAEPAPVERHEPIDRRELAQPVAYIAGRYVYSAADGAHGEGPRRGGYGRHRGSRAV